MDALEAIKTRRSTRKYLPDQIPDDQLTQILDAGRCAPCGGNSQSTHFIVIRNPKILAELVDIVQNAFAKFEVTPDMYKSMKASVLASKKGNYVFHYNAPILIVTANKISYGNSMADCSTAIENMMIAANSLDLGTCWINQLHWLDNDPTLREYMIKLGLKDDETICASMILGKPDSKDHLPIRVERPISGNPVTYVD